MHTESLSTSQSKSKCIYRLTLLISSAGTDPAQLFINRRGRGTLDGFPGQRVLQRSVGEHQRDD